MNTYIHSYIPSEAKATVVFIHRQAGTHIYTQHVRVLRVELNRIHVDSTAGQHIHTYILTYVNKQSNRNHNRSASTHNETQHGIHRQRDTSLWKPFEW